MPSSILVRGGQVRVTVADDKDMQDLRNVLGHILQVNNVVVLMGAGASYHLDSPRIRDVSRSDLDNLAVSAGTTWSDSSKSIVRAIVGDDTADLEYLLGALTSASSYANAMNNDSVDIKRQTFPLAEVQQLQIELNAALAVACDLPPAQCSFNGPPLGPHNRFFERLLGTRRQGAPRLRVFTTNYDLVIEKSLDDLGVNYIDGFIGTYTRRFLPSMYSVELYRKQSPHQRDSTVIDDLIYLYKLHGSINWRSVRKDGKHAIVSETLTSGQSDTDGRALIYPTPQKEGEILGFPYADLIRSFGDVLDTPETTLVIVGYGFGDAHINRILNQSLSANPTLQLLVVEPYGGVLEHVMDDRPASTTAAQMASSSEPRISVLAGAIAQFALLHECLPEPQLRQYLWPKPPFDADSGMLQHHTQLTNGVNVGTG